MKDPLRDIVPAYRLSNWLLPASADEEDARYAVSEKIAAGWAAIRSPVVATAHPRGCLLLFSESQWVERVREIKKLPNQSQFTRNLQRLLLGYATHLELSEKLIEINPALLEFSQIIDEAVLLPFKDGHAELWSEPCLESWMEDPDGWARAIPEQQ